MQVVINISEDWESEVSTMSDNEITDWLYLVIRNGVVLPKGYGRLIDADYCLRKAWCNFWRHEDEMEKKDKDYLLMHRFFEQNGFEVCQQTIVEAPTVLEADKESEELNA